MGTRKMERGLGIILVVLGVVLFVGLVGIVGAAARESQLTPGAEAPSASRRRAYVAMAVTVLLLLAMVIFGDKWWGAEAADYDRYIYKPLEMHAQLQAGSVLD